VLIVGATGYLGIRITKACLEQPHLLVSVLARRPERYPHEMKAVERAGGEVFRGDVTKPETIKNCTRGIHTVISCLPNDPNVIVTGQLNLLNDALKNQVKRFIPSEYSVDLDAVIEGVHLFKDDRIRFRKILQAKPIQHLYISTGWFMETYMNTMNKMKQRPCYWGQSLEQKIDFITCDDLAKYVTCAISDPNRSGHLRFRSTQLNTKEIAYIYNKVRSARIDPIKMGRMDNLLEDLEFFRKNGIFRHINTIQKGDVLRGITVEHQMFYYTGIGKLDKVDNDEFPMIKPKSFAKFLILHPSVKFAKK